jgi:hypothetical protein
LVGRLVFKNDLYTDSLAITTLDKQLSDAAMKEGLIEQIDSGKTNDARYMLSTELDGDILTINSMLDYSDARSHDLARKIFTRIGNYRAEHSVKLYWLFSASKRHKHYRSD